MISARGLGSIFVIPEHLIRSHHFVAQSFFGVSQNDLQEEFEKTNDIYEAYSARSGEGLTADDLVGGRNFVAEERADVGAMKNGMAVIGAVPSDPIASIYDRPKNFVTLDE